MTDDRRNPGYEPRFDIDYKFGEQAELFATDIIKALGTDRVEVKRDAQFENTGNVYIEFRCLRASGWQLSGIATTEAEYWAFVLHDETAIVIIATEALKSAARARYRPGSSSVKSCTRGSHPTEGVVIPISWLLQHGIKGVAA